MGDSFYSKQRHVESIVFLFLKLLLKWKLAANWQSINTPPDPSCFRNMIGAHLGKCRLIA